MKPFYVLSLLLVAASPASAQAPAPAQGPMTLFPAADLQWKEGPPAMPKGAKMAVLEAADDPRTPRP